MKRIAGALAAAVMALGLVGAVAAPSEARVDTNWPCHSC